ncbi:unnamed protein product, partial [Amoebophrya sp. A25]|eukprot:GSA25T00013772001.1
MKIFIQRWLQNDNRHCLLQQAPVRQCKTCLLTLYDLPLKMSEKSFVRLACLKTFRPHCKLQFLEGLPRTTSATTSCASSARSAIGSSSSAVSSTVTQNSGGKQTTAPDSFRDTTTKVLSTTSGRYHSSPKSSPSRPKPAWVAKATSPAKYFPSRGGLHSAEGEDATSVDSVEARARTSSSTSRSSTTSMINSSRGIFPLPYADSSNSLDETCASPVEPTSGRSSNGRTGRLLRATHLRTAKHDVEIDGTNASL